MQQMLDVATNFMHSVGLEFSTDPNPNKSKSKAIFVTGRRSALQKPVNLILCGQPLPWVQHATHLGHKFHESGTMEMDIRQKKAAFIGKSTEVREAFAFAAPPDVLAAVKLYAADMYGAMLWPLGDELATQVMNTWGVCVKLMWNLPRTPDVIGQIYE